MSNIHINENIYELTDLNSFKINGTGIISVNSTQYITESPLDENIVKKYCFIKLKDGSMISFNCLDYTSPITIIINGISHYRTSNDTIKFLVINSSGVFSGYRNVTIEYKENGHRVMTFE